MSLFPLCKFRAACSDPLIHLAMHCPSEFSGINPVKDVSVTRMDNALIRFSHRKFPWKETGAVHSKSKQFLVDSWVAETPLLRQLAEEETLFLAPDRWPEEVEKQFNRYPIPTPFELANLDFVGRELKGKSKSHHVLFLRAYAFGVPIKFMANLFMLNEASVVDYMRQGAKSLLESRKFVLWCMHLDISKLKSLSLSKYNIDKGILHKLKFRSKVIENPFMYPEEFFSFLTESPNVLTLCRSGVIRKKTLRVSPPFRIGHRLLQENNDKTTSQDGPSISP